MNDTTRNIMSAFSKGERLLSGDPDLSEILEQMQQGQRQGTSAVIQAVIPPLQQMQQQSTAAVIDAIQSIPIPQGVDPSFMIQVEAAIAGIQLTDIAPVVQILQSLSQQVEALSESKPTEWVFEHKRDPRTKLLTGSTARQV